MKTYYRDLITKKRRFTRGTPIRVCTGGPIDAKGVLFRSKSRETWIPGYLLEDKGLIKRMEGGNDHV